MCSLDEDIVKNELIKMCVRYDLLYFWQRAYFVL